MILGYRGNWRQASNSGQHSRNGVLALVVLVVVACAGCDGGTSRPGTAPSPSHSPSEPISGGSSTPAPAGGGGAACEPGPGRSVTDLPDVHVPAVHVAAVVDDDGRTVV